MRWGTLKFSFLKSGVVLASAFFAVNMAEGRPTNGSPAGVEFSPRNPIRSSQGQTDVDAFGQPILASNNINSGQHGLNGDGSLGDPARIDTSRPFHQNHVRLFTIAAQNNLNVQSFALLEELDRGVRSLREAGSDLASAARWSQWLWQKLKENELSHFFLNEKGEIKVDELGLALCVDGETSTGVVQPIFEKGLQADSRLKVTNLGKSISYSEFQGVGAGVTNATLASAATGDVPETTATTTGVVTSSPVRSPRPSTVSAQRFESTPARPPRPGVSSDGIPAGTIFQGCGLITNPNLDQNANNVDKDKNADKNEANNGAGNPPPPPPESPFPNMGSGQAGAGGPPEGVQPVKIANGNPPPVFNPDKAGADPFDYLKQIAAYGQFDTNYNAADTIRKMELSNLQYLQKMNEFINSLPIAAPRNLARGQQRGGSGSGGNRTNSQQLNEFAAATGGRPPNPFSGLFQ